MSGLIERGYKIDPLYRTYYGSLGRAAARFEISEFF